MAGTSHIGKELKHCQLFYVLFLRKTLQFTLWCLPPPLNSCIKLMSTREKFINFWGATYDESILPWMISILHSFENIQSGLIRAWLLDK